MKKIFLLLCMALIVQFSYSQKNQKIQLPEAVKNRFLFLFPQAIDSAKHPVSWEKTKGLYKANIRIMNAPAMVLIDSTGKAIRIEKTIHEQYLPDKIKSYLSKTYESPKLKSILKVTDENGKNTFNLVIETKPVFDEEGNLLKENK